MFVDSLTQYIDSPNLITKECIKVDDVVQFVLSMSLYGVCPLIFTKPTHQSKYRCSIKKSNRIPHASLDEGFNLTS